MGHRTLNTSREVVSFRDLLNIDVTERTDELRPSCRNEAKNETAERIERTYTSSCINFQPSCTTRESRQITYRTSTTFHPQPTAIFQMTRIWPHDNTLPDNWNSNMNDTKCQEDENCANCSGSYTARSREIILECDFQVKLLQEKYFCDGLSFSLAQYTYSPGRSSSRWGRFIVWND